VDVGADLALRLDVRAGGAAGAVAVAGQEVLEGGAAAAGAERERTLGDARGQLALALEAEREAGLPGVVAPL